MRIENKNVMVYVFMVQVIEGACRKSERGVDTLQAAGLPCSVSNGPVKKLKTSVGSLNKKQWNYIPGYDSL